MIRGTIGGLALNGFELPDTQSEFAKPVGLELLQRYLENNAREVAENIHRYVTLAGGACLWVNNVDVLGIDGRVTVLVAVHPDNDDATAYIENAKNYFGDYEESF